MNSIADKIQAAMEESWMEKECAVAEQDYHKAAAIRDWGDKLKKLIAEARQIDQTVYPTTTVHVSPFIKQGKPRFAFIPTLSGVPLCKEVTIKPDDKPAFYLSEGELDMTAAEAAMQFELTFHVNHPPGWGDEPEVRHPEEQMDGMSLLRYDGQGDLCESWVLCKVRVRSIQDEGEVEDGLNQYAVTIVYGLPITHREFKKVDFEEVWHRR